MRARFSLPEPFSGQHPGSRRETAAAAAALGCSRVNRRCALHRCRATSPLTPTARRSIDCPHTRAARSCWPLERVVHECMRRFPTLTHSRRDLCAPCSRAKPRSKESACCTNYGITLFQGRIENFRVQSASCRSKRARKRLDNHSPALGRLLIFFWVRRFLAQKLGQCAMRSLSPQDLRPSRSDFVSTARPRERHGDAVFFLQRILDDIGRF